MGASKDKIWTGIILFFFSISLSARTLKVGADSSYKTISAAIKAAQPKDIIEIYAGKTYSEHIIINKPLTLLGKNLPVISGGLRGNCINIKSDNVTIEGIKVIRSGRSSLNDFCGILVQNSNNVVIKKNIFRENQFSIMLQESNNCQVTQNNIASNIMAMQVMGNAVHCWKCNNLTITQNTIGHNRDGIYLEFVSHSYIKNNHIADCERYGLHFMFSHFNTYEHNSFRHNRAGVAVMYTHNIVMKHNIFEDNRGDSSYGLLLKEISHSAIYHNVFYNNTVGVLLDGGVNIKIQKNNLKDNGWGIRITSSSNDDVISYNNFIGNTFDITTNAGATTNIVDRNYWDKYQGYDLNKNGIGDIPFRPLTLFSTLAENNPAVLLFFHSFLMDLLDESEKILPGITPDAYVDKHPVLTPNKL